MVSARGSGGVVVSGRTVHPRGGSYGDGSATEGAGSRPPDVVSIQSPWRE